MVNDTSAGGPAEDEDVEGIPVNVILEIGRLEMVIGEVRQLAPGVVLPLARPAEEAIDIIVNGKRIGKGSLVRVGESLGVRVTRLSTDG